MLKTLGRHDRQESWKLGTWKRWAVDTEIYFFGGVCSGLFPGWAVVLRHSWEGWAPLQNLEHLSIVGHDLLDRWPAGGFSHRL